MGTGAIALSLPFACVLGLLASVTASTMGTGAKHTEHLAKYYYRKTSLLISFLNRASDCSEEQIHLGLRFDPVRPGGSLCSHILLSRKSISDQNCTTTKLVIPFLGSSVASFVSQIHLQAVLSVLFATFAGFGVVMSGSSILVEFLRWRRAWNSSSPPHSIISHPVTRPGQSPRTAVPSHPGPSQGPQAGANNTGTNSESHIC